MSGFEILIKKENSGWKLLLIDAAATFLLLTAVFAALFSVYDIGCEFLSAWKLQVPALLAAFFVTMGKRFRWIRTLATLLLTAASGYLLSVDLLRGMHRWLNSGISLLCACYNIRIAKFSGNTDLRSLLWILFVLELLAAIVFLRVLRCAGHRCWAVLLALFPFLLGIVFGKLPETLEGCFLIFALLIYLISSYQRKNKSWLTAVAGAGLLLSLLFLGARAAETNIYAYKSSHTDWYRDMKKEFITARMVDLSDWLPEIWKNSSAKQDSAKKENVLENQTTFSQLTHVDRTGKVIDTVVLEKQPQSVVYYTKSVGYVYTGEGWEEQGSEGVYDQLTQLSEFCAGTVSDTNWIAAKIDRLYASDFRYTTNPGRMPEDMDFAEGFLFVRKRGFCVHFATGATLIYQLCGVDARYVEGYKIPVGAFVRQADGSYKATVTDYMAHAWCETYEETGEWRVREHTIGSSEQQPITATPTMEPTVSPTTELTAQPTAEPTREPVESPSPTENGWNLFSHLAVLGMHCLLFAGIVSLLLAVILLQRKIRVGKREKKRKNPDMRRAILWTYQDIQYLCGRYLQHEDTIWSRENIDRAAKVCEQISPEEWRWIYDCAERCMFSNEEMLPADRKRMYDFYQILRRTLLCDMNRREKLWFLYGKAL